MQSVELVANSGDQIGAIDQSAFPFTGLRHYMTAYYRAALEEYKLFETDLLVFRLGKDAILSLFGTRASSGHENTFDYFGNHARLEINRNINLETLDPRITSQVSKRLFEYLGERGAHIEVVAKSAADNAMVLGLMEKARSHNITTEASTDPSRGHEHLTRSLNSGHRQSVKRGLERLGNDIRVFHMEEASDAISKFRDLHERAAGRVTRPEESWMLMEKAVYEGKAILTVAGYSTEMLGATFTWLGSGCAVYGTGAYDRDLFSEFPVSHCLVFRSMQEAGQLGCNNFILGKAFDFTEDVKLASIASFKRKFADEVSFVHQIAF